MSLEKHTLYLKKNLYLPQKFTESYHNTYNVNKGIGYISLKLTIIIVQV